MIGQEEAINSTARAMVRAQGGLKDPRRPIAALMFSGPTGVGKTELTKVGGWVGRRVGGGARGWMDGRG